MVLMYKFSVFTVVDETGTNIGTYATKETAEREKERVASTKPYDHGSFVTVKEIKVYGGVTDGEDNQ